MGETHNVLEVDTTGESWLAVEEVINVQMVDTELDLTEGHLEDRVMDAHMQFVSAEPDLELESL